MLKGPSATNLLYYFFYFAALYHFINKKIKILNVGALYGMSGFKAPNAIKSPIYTQTS
jgi:hypothetical protein